MSDDFVKDFLIDHFVFPYLNSGPVSQPSLIMTAVGAAEAVGAVGAVGATGTVGAVNTIPTVFQAVERFLRLLGAAEKFN